jgi:hypothetical protein
MQWGFLETTEELTAPCPDINGNDAPLDPLAARLFDFCAAPADTSAAAENLDWCLRELPCRIYDERGKLAPPGKWPCDAPLARILFSIFCALDGDDGRRKFNIVLDCLMAKLAAVPSARPLVKVVEHVLKIVQDAPFE